MKQIWESRLAATAFRSAVASPFVTGVLRRLDRLGQASAEELDAWQMARAQEELNVARRRVNAYSGDEYSGAWDDVPLLTKDDVRRGGEGFRNRRAPARRVTTGGTGGRPLPVDIAITSFLSEWAHIAYAWRTAGIALTDRKLTFRGSSLGRGFSGSPVFFQPTYNHYVVSPFHLSDGTFRELLAQVGDFQPVAIWGYPSAIAPFAAWVQRTGPHPALRKVRAILLASEGAYDWQIDLFKQVFDARIVRWYGQTEKVAFASGCPTTDSYHVLPTYGLVEIVDGKIVGTGFTNPAMPLIRYDTEDRGQIADQRCSSCGDAFPLLEDVRGRWDQAYLWGQGDEPISTSALNFHDPIFMNFDRFQFRQEEPGRALLLVSPCDVGKSMPSILESARNKLQNRVGDRLTIDIQTAQPEELLSARGKVLAIDQRYVPSRK